MGKTGSSDKNGPNEESKEKQSNKASDGHDSKLLKQKRDGALLIRDSIDSRGNEEVGGEDNKVIVLNERKKNRRDASQSKDSNVGGQLELGDNLRLQAHMSLEQKNIRSLLVQARDELAAEQLE